ncbi:YeeE/YedE family protein [Candidatus Methylospira mobilis]|uniref:YeeE/YedE family protein n=1 Tax=Candidatus Methylospira mobilis TaxID=1808979 RepID=UPI001884EC1B|nr:YeeE/YedE thiosulfate transporter family protein [Candidatus Methylospira mobilis]
MLSLHPFINALAGGVLIGISAALLMGLHGKILGVTGIIRNAFHHDAAERPWRWAFLAGVLAVGILVKLFAPALLEIAHPASPGLYIVSGLLVGYGAARANGCTSGHGVCGISRLSSRSIVATITFMTTSMLTVWIVKRL